MRNNQHLPQLLLAQSISFFLFFISFKILKNLSTSAVELGITNMNSITFARLGEEIFNYFIIVAQTSACDILVFFFPDIFL